MYLYERDLEARRAAGDAPGQPRWKKRIEDRRAASEIHRHQPVRPSPLSSTNTLASGMFKMDKSPKQGPATQKTPVRTTQGYQLASETSSIASTVSLESIDSTKLEQMKPEEETEKTEGIAMPKRKKPIPQEYRHEYAKEEHADGNVSPKTKYVPKTTYETKEIKEAKEIATPMLVQVQTLLNNMKIIVAEIERSDSLQNLHISVLARNRLEQSEEVARKLKEMIFAQFPANITEEERSKIFSEAADKCRS